MKHTLPFDLPMQNFLNWIIYKIATYVYVHNYLILHIMKISFQIIMDDTCTLE